MHELPEIQQKYSQGYRRGAAKEEEPLVQST